MIEQVLEREHHASGNYGLLDQIAALKWVQRNIANFGGDADKVTVARQSAGAGSVHFLAMSPLTKGLFHRAVTQSHARHSRDPELHYLASSYRTLADAESAGTRYAAERGARTLQRLRSLPWQKLVEGNASAVDSTVETGGPAKPPLFRPVVDGWLIPNGYQETYAKGLQNDVWYLAGSKPRRERRGSRERFCLAPDGGTEELAAGRSAGPCHTGGLRRRVPEEVRGDGREFLRLYPATTNDEAAHVRTLADVDLMPDELLTHLDDVVIRMQHEEGRLPDEISATCLYAVYDPVTRVCSLASAGHVLPAWVPPVVDEDRAGIREARFVEAPIGPPLGLGGLPFETVQFEVPEGSILALFTDGLIEGASRDPVSGLAGLRALLGRPGPSLDAVCDRIVEGTLPARPADDVALLLARTRALDADCVTTLELPSDPSLISRARSFATDQLAAWNLDELAFSTELIVSELVTNAIRCGRQPITLRLILQSRLICEVADGANTSPHLRRARIFDEGGRWLFLVAQLSNSWGTRYTREGKVIWAEQIMPGPSA